MMEQGPVSFEVSDNVAIVRVDSPPVNALSQAVRRGLLDAVSVLNANDTLQAAVLICVGRTFIAGADIKEFGKGPLEPLLPDVVDAIENSDKPWLAAIHGTALGGGFEVALGCHYRIMDPSAKVGLPEVKLGIIPGAGGTQRLPRLTGLEKAVDLITTGRQVKADEALELGLCDTLASDNVLQDAITFLKNKLAVQGTHPRTRDRAIEPLDDETKRTTIQAVTRRARGQLSPVKAAEIILPSDQQSFEEGMKVERATFLDLLGSDQANALRHAFFGERLISKVPGLEKDKARTVETIAVIGAGTMGAGIATAFKQAGYAVTVIEREEAALEAGRSRITGLYDAMVKRGRLTEKKRDEALTSFGFASELKAVADADLIIEAVFEDMDVKIDLFRKLEEWAKPDAVLATNTSYLDINEIAASTTRAADIIGLHFFSPAHIMKLLEIVRADKTASDVLATALAVAKRLGKIGVVAGVCDGFIGNRIWSTTRKQFEFMMEDGAMPEEIDVAMSMYGFPMGPFAVYDLSGLDIAWAQRKRLATTRGPQERYVDIPDILCEAGRLGQKTGAGYYRYEVGDRRPYTDPDVIRIIMDVRKAKGITPVPISAEEIQRRALAVMVNEGARILSEGIALRPVDIDMVMIHGYGFPSWRGGPMQDADRIGLDVILQEVEAMCTAGGYGWEPANLLKELVETGGSFADLNTR